MHIDPDTAGRDHVAFWAFAVLIWNEGHISKGLNHFLLECIYHFVKMSNFYSWF
jgi:hypothetical protein